MDREKPADTLSGEKVAHLQSAGHPAPPARDYGPLPAGDYVAHVVDGTLKRTSRGKNGYWLTFRVAEGKFAGRLFEHIIWLTEAALEMAVRDLEWLGVSDLMELLKPLPKYKRCRVRLAQLRSSGGSLYNRVRFFQVIGIDPAVPGEPQAG